MYVCVCVCVCVCSLVLVAETADVWWSKQENVSARESIKTVQFLHNAFEYLFTLYESTSAREALF